MSDPSEVVLAEEAARLRTTATEAFTSQDYSLALSSYSQAIELAPQTALLHSNRSLTHLKLGNLDKALEDAKKTVELEPGWERGWQRIGQVEEARGMNEAALEAFVKAKELAGTSADYDVAIKRLRIAVKKASGSPSKEAEMEPRIERLRKPGEASAEDMPWMKILDAMTAGKAVLPEGGCIKVVRAWQSWATGEEALKKQQTAPSDDPKAHTIESADPMALQHLSNGILADTRVLVLSSTSFFDSLNVQIAYESRVFGTPWGPSPSAPLASTQSEIRAVLRASKWETLRYRLSLSIRLSVIKGVMFSKVLSKHEAGVEMLDWALAIIEWVREEWKDVPKEERGTVFEASFERAVRQALLNVLEAYLTSSPSATTSAHLISSLHSHALSLLSSAHSFPAPSPQLQLTFDTYPTVTARKALGLCWLQRGQAQMDSESPTEVTKGRQAVLMSALEYARAALAVPVDDEMRQGCIALALSSLLVHGGIGMGDLRKVVKGIKAELDVLEDIWGEWGRLGGGSGGLVRKLVTALDPLVGRSEIGDEVVVGPIALEADGWEGGVKTVLSELEQGKVGEEDKNVRLVVEVLLSTKEMVEDHQASDFSQTFGSMS